MLTRDDHGSLGCCEEKQKAPNERIGLRNEAEPLSGLGRISIVVDQIQRHFQLVLNVNMASSSLYLTRTETIPTSKNFDSVRSDADEV